MNLCEKWERILSHGLKTNLSNSAIQNFVAAGLNLTFNIVNIGKYVKYCFNILFVIILYKNITCI